MACEGKPPRAVIPPRALSAYSGSAGECERWLQRRLLEARLARVFRLKQHQPSLLAFDDLVHDLETTTAAGAGPAVISDLIDAASACGPDGTTDVSISEGVTVTDQHRRSESKIAS